MDSNPTALPDQKDTNMSTNPPEGVTEAPKEAPEATPEEGRSKKVMVLEKKIADLEVKIARQEEEKEVLVSTLRDKDHRAVVKRHIDLLHRYNEIRDIGMGLLGMIADQRGVRLRDVMDEYEVDDKD